MKVRIDRDRDGWRYFVDDVKSEPLASYPQVVRRAVANGHEVDNAGWLHRLLMWQFNHHALDGYPEWEIESERSPAFVKLSHETGNGPSSHEIAAAWDDLAKVDFYQRDWTEDGIPFVNEDGIPFVNKGEIYWSGWWFATVAERDRFVEWNRKQGSR